jgi:hypothetical protein
VLQLVVKVLHHLFQHVARDLGKLDVATRLSEGVCTSVVAEWGRRGGGCGTYSRRRRVPKSSVRASLPNESSSARHDDQATGAINVPEDSIVRIKPETRAAFLSTMNLCLSALQRCHALSSCVTPEGSALVLSSFVNHPACDKPDESDVLRDGRAVASF